MKVVINKCFGGFGLSKAARERYLKLGGTEKYDFQLDRTNEHLIRVVEELGPAASDSLAKLVVVDIPDGVEYEIDEYDGMESIHEQHRSWS